MASFSRLILWTCVLHFCTFATSENPTSSVDDPLTGEYLTCRHNVRVLLLSEMQTSPHGWGKGQSDILKFLGRIMEQILTTSKESGIHCTSDKPSYTVICCDTGNLDQFNNILDIKELTASNKFWYHDMGIINFVFLLINIVLFMVIMCSGVMLLIDYQTTGDLSPPNESIEIT